MQELILDGNWLENKSTGVLAKVLRELSIERLRLRDNKLSAKGLMTFFYYLKTNRSLTHLDLSDNNFSDYEAGKRNSLDFYLDSNQSLESLKFENCNLEKDFCKFYFLFFSC